MHGSYASETSSPIQVSRIEEQRGLLRRILASPQFAHAETLQRVLRFLFENAKNQDSAPKEYEIALSAIGRPASFDPKTDAIVRVSMARIRERLQEYFEGEGRREAICLELPKGQYRLRFVRSERFQLPIEDDRTFAALHRFWETYVSGSRRTCSSTPSFFFFETPMGTIFAISTPMMRWVTGSSCA